MEKIDQIIHENKKTILTLANQITILRLILVPGIVICLIENWFWAAITLLGICMITDLLDGFVARLRHETSNLGAFLDPMADKIMLTALFLTLTYLDMVDMWVFVVIFSRDLLIVLGWAIIYILTGSHRITPRILGKVTTLSQMTTVVVVLFQISTTLETYLIWLMVGLTIASTLEYIIIGEKRLGEWG